MPKEYTCGICGKVFNQKIAYDRHSAKKNACVTIDELRKTIEKSEEKVENKSELKTCFKYCLDVLRSEHLTGDKALRTLANLLDLKLLEPQIGKEIDFDSYEYDFSHVINPERHKEKLLTIVKFSKLVEEKDDNLIVNMKFLWDDILSQHPKTDKIFLEGKGFDIKNKATFRKLINKLNSVDFTKYESDILGEAYEEVIQDIMTGKVLGQFFTPVIIKKFMINLVKPVLFKNGRCETIYDPAMGTGGFLISAIRSLITQSKQNNVKIDWEYIKSEGIGGREAEPDTFQLAVSNMLISSGHMFDFLEKGDSINIDKVIHPEIRKVDVILANPPFGIKGLNYKDIEHPLKENYLPIETNNAVLLFLQLIIYMLNIGGRCAVVLPDGQELFNKTNSAMVSVREFLMKTCDLKEIHYMPSGVFTNTGIKTCVFYFVKKREGEDIIHRDKNDNITFSKTYQTKIVKFYDNNIYENKQHLLIEVPIEIIAANSYSLNYAEYLQDEVEIEQYAEGVIVKTLGEVCEIQNGKRIVKEQVETGEYPVLGGGGFTSFYTNEYTREGKTCKISREGMSLHNCVMILNEKYYLNSQAFTIKSKTYILKNEYLWYFLENNKAKVFECGRGTAQKAIDIEKFKLIKIPIPPVEDQNEIVEYLDFIYEKCVKTSEEKIVELKRLNSYTLKMQKILGENIIEKLGDTCSIEYGTRIVKSNNNEGQYPVYGSGRAMFTTDSFNRDEFNILIGRFALSQECVRFINEKIFLNDSGLTIKPKKNNILHKFIGYYLINNQNIIYSCARGTAQKNLEIETFKSIKIPIPSLVQQQVIIDYCEKNDIIIQQLEQEIEQNKKMASNFFTNMLSKKNITEEISVPDERTDTSQSSVTSKSSEKSSGDSKKKSSKKKIVDA